MQELSAEDSNDASKIHLAERSGACRKNGLMRQVLPVWLPSPRVIGKSRIVISLHTHCTIYERSVIQYEYLGKVNAPLKTLLVSKYASQREILLVGASHDRTTQ